MSKKSKTADYLEATARYTLLLWGILIFFFALASGARAYGGGIGGMIRNSPNALPWLFLLILLSIAWKRPLIGGILITLLGAAMVYFFNFSGPNFWWITFIITVSITILGIFFILSHFLRK